MSAELKPCPFCGGNPLHQICTDDTASNYGGYFIECEDCKASTKLFFSCGENITEQLIAAWNRRATVELSDEIKTLRRQRDALLSVVKVLEESAGYWSEYDVPLGIVDRLKQAIKECQE